MTSHTETLHVTSAGRLERLAAQARSLHSRGTSADPHRLLLIAGGVLMPLGVLVILLGWAGASRTPLLFEQIPYLISGGLLGLGLVFVGGFLYFAYWQTATVRAARSDQKQLIDALGRIETLLSSGAAVAGQANGAAARPSFVATESGTMFHRPDCVVVADRSGLQAVDPVATDLRPCKLCDPLSAQ